MLDNRLPQSDGLVGRTVEIARDDGILSLSFDAREVAWRLPDGRSGTDAYDAVEVADGYYFVDVWTRSWDDRQTLTAVVNLPTGSSVSVLTRAVGTAADLRFDQEFVAGRVVGQGVESAAPLPGPTRELLGRRILSIYSDELVFEQLYLNPRSCAWQCIRGWTPGQADVDEATYWRLADDLYLFGFREAVARSSSVLLLDFARSRSTGKFFSELPDRTLLNGALGARLETLSTTVYPVGFEPVD
jgi:hypothetical protein